MTINCPRCGEDTGVYNTRGDGVIVHRGRYCKSCGYTFNTFETIGENDEIVKRLRNLSKKGNK